VKHSAGVLLVRPGPQFLLAHPGGPYWARRDDGWWSIPKGLVEPGETPRAAAAREFVEETGFALPERLVSLGTVDQSRKRIHAWLGWGDADPAQLVSGTVEVEWPPRSGRRISVPEVDRVGWFDPLTATRKILPAQAPLLLRAMAVQLGGSFASG